jgi:hypothetical protein
LKREPEPQLGGDLLGGLTGALGGTLGGITAGLGTTVGGLTAALGKFSHPREERQILHESRILSDVPSGNTVGGIASAVSPALGAAVAGTTGQLGQTVAGKHPFKIILLSIRCLSFKYYASRSISYPSSCV